MLKGILSTMTCLVLAAVPPVAFGQAEAHGHKAPHGGTVKTAGKYHLELVRTDTGLDVYLLDEKEDTLPIDGVTGHVTCLTKDKKKIELELQPADGRLVANTGSEELEGGTVVVALRRGEETLSAKFTLAAQAEHAHH